MSMIAIADEALAAVGRLRDYIGAEIIGAVENFQANNGNNNELAANMLATLQAIEANVNEPILSTDSLVTLVKERQHFRDLANHNRRAAKAMKTHRDKRSPPNETP